VAAGVGEALTQMAQQGQFWSRSGAATLLCLTSNSTQAAIHAKGRIDLE